MVKNLIVFIALFILTTQAQATKFYNPTDEDFKEGFQAGLKALEFQLKNEGNVSRKIKIKKPYLVIFETKNMPLGEIIFLQNIAVREGFETYLTKNFLTFGNFEREADAKETTKILETKYKIKAKIQTIDENTYLVTYPVLWGDFYNMFLEEVQKLGYAIKVEIIETKPTTQKKTTSSSTKTIQGSTQKKPQKMYLINPKAMAYENIGKEQESKDYREVGFKSGSFYLGNYGKAITTTKGEKFYKVINQNLYFSESDVIIKE